MSETFPQERGSQDFAASAQPRSKMNQYTPAVSDKMVSISAPRSLPSEPAFL